MEELSAAATGFLWDSGGGEAAAAGRFIGGGTLAGDRRQKEDQARAVTHATRVGEGEGKGKKKCSLVTQDGTCHLVPVLGGRGKGNLITGQSAAGPHQQPTDTSLSPSFDLPIQCHLSSSLSAPQTMLKDQSTLNTCC